MEFFEVLLTRRSIRRFKDQDIEKEKLDQLLEAVRTSPSWANKQCWRMVVVKSPEVRKQLSEASYVESFFAPLGYKINPAMKGLAEAPVVMVACADPSHSGTIRNQEYYLVDMGIAAQSLMLTARAMGLGTVFVGVYDEDRVKGLLGIPKEVRVVGLFPVGYPLKEPSEGPERKALNEIASIDNWQNEYR